MCTSLLIDFGHNIDGPMGHNNDLEKLDQWAESTNDNANNNKTVFEYFLSSISGQSGRLTRAPVTLGHPGRGHFDDNRPF